MTQRPTIQEGDSGPDVKDLVALLPLYSFDSTLTEAVITYQRSRGLDADGIVGPQTWAALESGAPPYMPPGLPLPMPPGMQDAIEDIASNSAIAGYDWDDRGEAPIGYTKGVALAFGNCYRAWKGGYPPAVDMAKAATDDPGDDVLAWYADDFRRLGMSNSQDGAATLRHLWIVVLGLGMRESSGQHCCGRDQSASNTSADTAEAGAWQTSYDAHTCSPHFDTVFASFEAAVDSDYPQGFLDAFSEDVSCSGSNWDNYGTGSGCQHQDMSKNQPAYAAEVCAITLRHRRNHYGPVNRNEVELRHDADDMLREVQACIDRVEALG
jgi:hypothetical protein